jgi:signal transduction histidine kinase
MRISKLTRQTFALFASGSILSIVVAFSISHSHERLLSVDHSLMLLILLPELAITALVTGLYYHHQAHEARLTRELARIRHEVAQQEALNQQKDTLLHTVSHDLRNPLGSIMGFTELLCEEIPADAPHAHWLSLIRTSGRKMEALINDLLLVQEIENGPKLDIAPVAVCQVLDASVFAHHWSAQEKNITLDYQPPPATWQVCADARRLEQIFDNLLSNAIKYTPEGGFITVRASYHLGRLNIDIADTGLGIPDEALPHLFEKFYRVRSEQHLAQPGTGLGLSIVRLLTVAMGGRVSARNNISGGSTFRVELPMSALEVQHTPPQRQQVREVVRV